jgi:hypothetical protein
MDKGATEDETGLSGTVIVLVMSGESDGNAKWLGSRSRGDHKTRVSGEEAYV